MKIIKRQHMKHKYMRPHIEVVDITPRQIICTSGEKNFQAEIDGYSTNTGGEFSQN